ncbi:MAG: hypothetical protein WCE62_08575, partial [Polyangiales bacterium]
MNRLTLFATALAVVALGASCTDDTSSSSIRVGAASRSILPTVGGTRDYLADAPGWPDAATLDPDDPGLFVAAWDQGRVDVGNGSDDGSWVHDDLTATAVAFENDEGRVVLVSSDT